ncbi:sel1 repeat family protein [Helicobacter saguini]|uniref:Beta-lactamase n=1 Tax=Helicobacter saguini TaxID=1548018 RepID=A0A347VMJ7_9HELI|nr:sel1 repeat family protein [Helicobacter saguini]MWV68225.1 sel1 repeat family protein [Helicobacter saguini]MWV70311.1 sel1 repeat family protein [Helicobacter saguini]MWV72213.1 sel1 repeat family protein [Helicobacter saguini]TLD95355.1 sel1 repeat family protein [Helicobacter saguini]
MCFVLWLFVLNAKEDSVKNRLVVECANSHLESCETLLENIPSIESCDATNECEFSGWVYAQVQDYNRSIIYLQKACDSNYFEACNKLGFSFQRLNNYKKAKKYYKIACDRDNMNACFNLASLYIDGLGVGKSYEKANKLYEKICNNSEGIGCLHLALAYINGDGVKKNISKALRYFKQGCDLGNNKSCELYDKNNQ